MGFRLTRPFPLGRLSQRLFSGPVVEAISQAALVYSDNFGPFGKAVRFPIKRNADIVARIPLLLKLGGPSAVLWRVITIGVNAVNGMIARWPRPHIIIERLKIMKPPVAHFNATTAIVREMLIPWIGASPDHVLPTRVGEVINHSVSSQKFGPETTATLGCSTCQRECCDVLFCATNTTALDVSALTTWTNHSPATEYLSDTFGRSLGNCGMIAHVGSLLTRLSAKHLGVSAPQVHLLSPIINRSLSFVKRGKRRRYELPYWGRWEDVICQ